MPVSPAIPTQTVMEPARTGTHVATRLTSVDLWRGVVMVLMAIDHVRVYSGVPAGGPDPGVFFTRWVTHFCAPAFVFLAGTGAFLYGRRIEDPGKLARYLATRGLILVLLELTIIRLAWTFSLSSLSAPLAGVIWMLGWCMVLLAAVIRLPLRGVAVFGFLVVAAQDLFGVALRVLPPSAGWVAQLLYTGGQITLGESGLGVWVLYSIVPWIGVMALGYAFGAIVIRPTDERRRLCFGIGISATALFLIVGTVATFLGPAGDGAPPALLRLLNQRKYPASQLFLAMTLGPPIAFLPFAEHARGRVVDVLTTFGRVPMFYYLLHIPVIHALALLVWRVRNGSVNPEWFASAPAVSVPGQPWSLPLLFAVFALAVCLLYFPCRSFTGVKANGRHRWLRYL